MLFGAYLCAFSARLLSCILSTFQNRTLKPKVRTIMTSEGRTCRISHWQLIFLFRGDSPPACCSLPGITASSESLIFAADGAGEDDDEGVSSGDYGIDGSAPWYLRVQELAHDSLIAATRAQLARDAKASQDARAASVSNGKVTLWRQHQQKKLQRSFILESDAKQTNAALCMTAICAVVMKTSPCTGSGTFVFSLDKITSWSTFSRHQRHKEEKWGQWWDENVVQSAPTETAFSVSSEVSQSK